MRCALHGYLRSCALAQELPESLGKLRNLKVLAADQNRIFKVSPAIFRGCSSLQTLALHENPMTIEDLTSTDGYDLLEARRRKKFDQTGWHRRPYRVYG